jgi:negative regulator of flagellin synthesis FlgM
VRAPAVAAVPTVSSQTVTSSQQSPTLAKELAAKPPVDSNRVQRIKDALANGTFPISPATLADQLIALRYDWLSNDPA